jgi:hypothetical protein
MPLVLKWVVDSGTTEVLNRGGDLEGLNRLTTFGDSPSLILSLLSPDYRDNHTIGIPTSSDSGDSLVVNVVILGPKTRRGGSREKLKIND